MNVGLDIGYFASKAVAKDRRVLIHSAVGSPDKARFSFSEDGVGIILTEPAHILVGEQAVRQSRFLDRREDRAWIESEEYYHLVLAAFTETTTATRTDLHIVTGLPIAFYNDKDRLRDILLSEHRATREDRRAQVFRVSAVRVIPQPFGALLAEALDDKGAVVNSELISGEVGIIDVGGKTTNLLSVSGASEVSKETASVALGAWDVVRAVRDWLSDHTKLEPRDHQIVDAIIARQIKQRGEPIDLEPVVNDVLASMSKQVISQATQLWNGGDALDAILVSGGGAHLLGDAIRDAFPHARTVQDPVFANALGYWRFAQYLEAEGKW